jgi:BarA-like signal transduction histidine kinase
MVLEIEADQGLSDEPDSIMDQVLVGLISASRTPLLLVDERAPTQLRR